jgi:membrane associated rhomboid family serine protease
MGQYGQPTKGRGFGGFSYFPPVVKALLVTNIGIFLVEILFSRLMIGGMPLNELIDRYGALYPINSGGFEIWQPITYMFLHGSLTHVLFNMFALWMFGIELEQLWGSKKFLIFYTVCGLGGAAAHLFITPILNLPPAPLIGASGAIFGLLVAFGLMFPDRMIYLYFLIPVKAKYFVVLFMGLEIWSVGGADNIGHLAHLGGGVVGILYMIFDSGGTQLLSKLRTKKTDEWGNPTRPSGFGTMQKPQGFFNRPDRDEPVEAEYHDIGGSNAQRTEVSPTKSRVITQEVIDGILDKIAASGYQNLTTDEREILLEAAKKMDEKR